MKKSRLIALTLVVALMLMGTAYAAWTQTINVTSNVETGVLDITPTAATETRGAIMQYTNGGWGGANHTYDLLELDYVITEGENGNDTVAFAGSNYFPGSEFRTYVTFKNTGSIPADFELELTKFNMPQSHVKYSFYADGKPAVSGYDLGTALDQLGSFTLEPNEEVKIFLRLLVEPDATELTVDEDTLYSFEYNVIVSQFNIDN
jgi:hypothetical protein